MPLEAFGARAEAYAARLPDGLDWILFDEVDFGDALAAAMDRAYLGGPVLVAPVLTERRAATALDATPAILRDERLYWRRRQRFEALREQHPAPITKKERDSIGDVLATADSVVLRSFAELQRLHDLVGYRPLRCERAVAPPRVAVPAFRPVKGVNTIVVWAPELAGVEAALFAFAFEELRVPVAVACREPAEAATLGLRARFVDAADRTALEPLLGQAAALIDASAEDSGTAVALAALGIPLATSFASGAYEYVDGLYHYDLWDFRSILHAGLAALGGEPPIVRADVPRPERLRTPPPRLEPPVVDDPPLVSVILPTLNRHGILPRAIDSLARQTYPNIELIVVNDGGKPIDEIVARLPNVTIINHATPQGPEKANNAALRRARGKYVFYFSDDEYVFPSNFSRLIYALERTGEAAAVGMCAESYLQPGEDGTYDFIGTSIMSYRSTDPTVLLSEPYTIALTAKIIRRDAVEAVGAWDEATGAYCDYDWHLRLMRDHDFLWVPHLLGNTDTRLDNSSYSGEMSLGDRADMLDVVFGKVDGSDRPDIAALRENLLLFYRGKGGKAPPQRGVTRLREPRRGVVRMK